jgi:hypothetical protein
VGESAAPLEAPAPPDGTVTFKLTDLEGSTRPLEAHPAALPLIRVAGPRTYALPRTAAGEDPDGFFIEAILRARESRGVTGERWSTA